MTITAEQALGMTIEEIVERHYLPEKARRRRPNTVYGYTSSIRLHVLPRWGACALGSVTHDEVQDWADELSRTKAGAGGAEKAYKCLRQVIRWAMDKWGVLMVDPTRTRRLYDCSHSGL